MEQKYLRNSEETEKLPDQNIGGEVQGTEYTTYSIFYNHTSYIFKLCIHCHHKWSSGDQTVIQSSEQIIMCEMWSSELWHHVTSQVVNNMAAFHSFENIIQSQVIQI